MYIKLWLRERKTKGEPISEPCESLTWFALSTAQTCLISAFFEDYYTEKTKHVAKCLCVCACVHVSKAADTFTFSYHESMLQSFGDAKKQKTALSSYL